MQENERGGEWLPRGESQKPEDEKRLSSVNVKNEAGKIIDSNEASLAGYVLEGIHVHPHRTNSDQDNVDRMIPIGTNANEVMNKIDDYTSDQHMPVVEFFSGRG
jgi:hypothetical protein